ncbi:hypothetical protein [Neoroseomonas oryzicola]|uniref:Uncharacterized protein n=1 Tax=Neoroseomonas oryzicola TaxID=535904 RepID=A0A9X9WLI4_9PROT|nr:hypothetical protein [Neoroseomonas oryzicola]MBR0661194.1 hypothetical protein [Neoroseomonas oryzicola]NKE17559.1 hypothetical protein [Neoroseomonas oryzicola]
MTTTEIMSTGFICLHPEVITAFPIEGESMTDARIRARRMYPGRSGMLVSREAAARLARRGH